MFDVDKPALGALVGPRTVEEFFAGYWPDKTTCFVSEGDPERLPDCLRSKELSSFKALWRVNTERVAFTNGPKSSHMLPVDNAHASNLFDMGLTIFFDNITSCVPDADSFVRQLEMDLGIRKGSARLTAWISPKENGAACHYDANDIISIQLQGTKHFEVAPVTEVSAPYGMQYSPDSGPPGEDLYPQMTKGFPRWENAKFDTIEMKPGTVLFFHRGTWHRTYASTDSLAVSIVMDPPTAAECVLEQLRMLMIQDPRWRKPIYGAWGTAEQRQMALAEVAGLIQDIPKIGRALSPQDVILPTLSLEERITLIDRNSRFQRVPTAQISAEQQPELDNEALQLIQIIGADADGVQQKLLTIEIPRQYIDIVKWIAEQSMPFYAYAMESKFPEVPFDDQKRLLEVCVRGGLLALLWFPSLNDDAAL